MLQSSGSTRRSCRVGGPVAWRLHVFPACSVAWVTWLVSAVSTNPSFGQCPAPTGSELIVADHATVKLPAGSYVFDFVCVGSGGTLLIEGSVELEATNGIFGGLGYIAAANLDGPSGRDAPSLTLVSGGLIDVSRIDLAGGDATATGGNGGRGGDLTLDAAEINIGQVWLQGGAVANPTEPFLSAVGGDGGNISVAASGNIRLVLVESWGASGLFGGRGGNGGHGTINAGADIVSFGFSSSGGNQAGSARGGHGGTWQIFAGRDLFQLSGDASGGYGGSGSDHDEGGRGGNPGRVFVSVQNRIWGLGGVVLVVNAGWGGDGAGATECGQNGRNGGHAGSHSSLSLITANPMLPIGSIVQKDSIRIVAGGAIDGTLGLHANGARGGHGGHALGGDHASSDTPCGPAGQGGNGGRGGDGGNGSHGGSIVVIASRFGPAAALNATINGGNAGSGRAGGGAGKGDPPGMQGTAGLHGAAGGGGTLRVTAREGDCLLNQFFVNGDGGSGNIDFSSSAGGQAGCGEGSGIQLADGRPGGNGIPGVAGANGAKVTVVTPGRFGPSTGLVDIQCQLFGGSGGLGGGGSGGGSGGYTEYDSGSMRCCQCGNGGDGGNGARGGRGGSGGSLRIIAGQCASAFPWSQISVGGGVGGDGGAAGAGGGAVECYGWICCSPDPTNCACPACDPGSDGSAAQGGPGGAVGSGAVPPELAAIVISEAGNAGENGTIPSDTWGCVACR